MIDGREVVVSGTDGGTIQLWDPRTGLAIGEPFGWPGWAIESLALGMIGGRETIVSVFSNHLKRKICWWDARTREQIDVAHTGIGQSDVIVSGDNCSIRRWDMRKGKRDERAELVACGMFDGREVAVTGDLDGRIQLWDAKSKEPIGQPLVGHLGGSTSVALGVFEGRTVIVSGSSDGTLRLWDLEIVQKRDLRPKEEFESVRLAGLCTIDGNDVVVLRGEGDTIHLLDARTGLTVDAPHPLRKYQDIIDLYEIDGRLVAVTETGFKPRDVWDVHTGKRIYPAINEPVSELVDDGGRGDGTIRLRNGQTGESKQTVLEIGEPIDKISTGGKARIAVATRRGVLLLKINSIASS
jgi:WD40 repeat protein